MPDRLERFTERARKVLSYAQEEAQRFHHNYIGTEHLLLGLLREHEGVGARALLGLGVELARVRSAVEHIIGRGDRLVMGEIGLTPRAKKVIELAVDEARRLGHHYVGTEHLLLGLVREGEGIAAGVLTGMHVALDQVRAEVLRILAEPSEAPAPRQTVRPEGGQIRISPHGLGPPPAARPALRSLLRVLPIAQSQAQGGVEITLLSLEVYAEGSLVLGRIIPERGRASRSFPELVLVAEDDRGGKYQPQLGAGSGDDQEWRFTFLLSPPLDPTARELRLEIAEVRWRRPDPAGGGWVTSASETLAGPWTFVIPLPGS